MPIEVDMQQKGVLLLPVPTRASYGSAETLCAERWSEEIDTLRLLPLSKTFHAAKDQRGRHWPSHPRRSAKKLPFLVKAARLDGTGELVSSTFRFEQVAEISVPGVNGNALADGATRG
jgi:hypothetical protein